MVTCLRIALVLFGVPVGSIGLLATTMLYEEPYPTLLMPGFSSAEPEYYESTSFLVVHRDQTRAELSEVDVFGDLFGQSFAKPLAAAFTSNVGSEAELLWLSETLASQDLAACGDGLLIQRQRLRPDAESDSAVVEVILEGDIQC